MSADNKKKRIRWIAALVVIVILAGIIGIVAYIQRGNIEALTYVKKYSDDERRKLLEENEQAIVEILEQLPEVSVKPLPKEAEEMLQNGDLSKEDAINIITGKSQIEDFLTEESGETEKTGAAVDNGASENNGEGGNPTGTSSPAEEPGTTQKPAEVNKADFVAANGNFGKNDSKNNGGEASQPSEETAKSSELEKLIAEIYLLRSSFSGQIDSLVAQAKNEYIANKGQNKAGIAGKYLRKATDLEASCDAQMESILSKITAEIQRTGGNSGIVSEIRSAYENEKSIKKAELIAKYNS